MESNLINRDITCKTIPINANHRNNSRPGAWAKVENSLLPLCGRTRSSRRRWRTDRIAAATAAAWDLPHFGAVNQNLQVANIRPDVGVPEGHQHIGKSIYRRRKLGRVA